MRHTPLEVEEQIDGAAWRVGIAYDLAAWHALQVGAKREGRVSVRDVLGRAPLPLDPRRQVAEEGPTAEEMALFDRAGIPGGIATPEEVERAYAEVGVLPV